MKQNKKRVLIAISLMAVILFSGCSNNEDFSIDYEALYELESESLWVCETDLMIVERMFNDYKLENSKSKLQLYSIYLEKGYLERSDIGETNKTERRPFGVSNKDLWRGYRFK